MIDLVLSSGFFAFARHLGVLEALAHRRIVPDAVVGTSSGALVGALWVSGMPLPAIARLLSERPPAHWLSLHSSPWQGLFSTRRIEAELSRHLPRTFAELERPFAVGVADSDGHHQLIHSGPLVEAVAASGAIPVLIAPVTIDGRRYHDGGAVDRLALDAAARHRPGRRFILHEVERSRGVQSEQVTRPALHIKTARASATLFSMGLFHFEKEEARTAALAALHAFV
jgi:predicted acylesterase/phospholipase RssA